MMGFGSDEQKEKYLRPLARRHAGYFCPTEPHTGSDASGDHGPSAVRDGDHYVLNGVKQFITTAKSPGGGGLAVTDKARHRRLHRAHRNAGLHRRARRGKARAACVRHGAKSCSITAACRPSARPGRCRLPYRARQPEAGRIGIAAQSVGGIGARRRSTPRCTTPERVAFGKPLEHRAGTNFRPPTWRRRSMPPASTGHHAAT